LTPAAGRRGRCVLVIHRVVGGPLERDHDLSVTEFETLVRRLVDSRTAISADLGAAPDDGAVVLTFDDASSDHVAAAETLTGLGIPAVFFASAGVLGTPGHLDGPALRALADAGHVIGSHGWSHARLDRVSGEDLDRELVASRAALEDEVGRPVTLFAPAGGIGRPDLEERLRAAGYVASRSTRWGIHRRAADAWDIPTVPVTEMTAARGWVGSATTKLRLPLTMVAVGLVRSVLRPDVRSSLRGRILGRTGNAAEPPRPDA
jgi:peptidoglycan/xylan/chitin deacetylase (PgdA/CDA1 family)